MRLLRKKLIFTRKDVVMADKILSIIVPSYNMEAYLPKCLQSLIVDDKEVLRLLDVIIVNDGSQDRTSEIAHEYEKQYPCVFRVVDKQNANYGSCINAALPLAEGVFVRILDADDTYDSKALCRLVKTLCKSEVLNEHIDMFLTPYSKVGMDNNEVKLIEYKMLSADKIYRPNELSLIARSIAMHAITYRTNCLMSIEYHQTEGISYTDTEWCFKPIIAVDKWRYVPYAVYRYSIGREGQTVSKVATVKNFWMYRCLFEGMMKWYSATKFDEAYRSFLAKRLEMLGTLIYHTIINCLPMKTVFYEFDSFDRILNEEPILYEKLSGLSLSRIFNWHYVSYFRSHSRMRIGYLRMLRAYLWSKNIICSR